MSDLNESRRVSFCTDEISCRYLNIDLPMSLRSPTYTGRFGQQLKKFGIEKLPFGITLSELVLCDALVPSLYVALPKEYFDTWKNFPECPRQSDFDDGGMVGMYACQPMPQLATFLHDLLHPYDGELRSSFRESFETEIPESLSVCDHANGGKYIPAEAYLPYWQVYALAGNFHKYRHAEIFLSPDVGRPRCLQLIKSAARSFIEKHDDAFKRISWYKTISASSNFSQVKFKKVQLIEFAKTRANLTVNILKEDLRLLLELDADWHSTLKKFGCTVLEKARSSLSKDIYLIYEQLQLLGAPASSIFEDFTPDIYRAHYTPLNDVLQAEGYGFKKSFTLLGAHYCGQIQRWGYDCTDDVFDSLIQVRGFDAWIRAFHDLHESINDPNKRPVSFRQNRIVDALIVMAVRTEIVLREMFRSLLNAASDESIVDFLKAIKCHIADRKQKIIGEASSKNNSECTKLHQRPSSLFAEIEKISFEKWSKEDIFFLHALLKFITARNYFAHHAYKDDEVNIQTSTLSKHILEILLSTLLFFHKNKATGETICCA